MVDSRNVSKTFHKDETPAQVTIPVDERKTKSFPVFDSKISFYEGGVFTDENKKTHEFKGGIKIKTPSMDRASKISARALVGIYFVINDNPDVKEFLRARVAEEKTTEKEL